MTTCEVCQRPMKQLITTDYYGNFCRKCASTVFYSCYRAARDRKHPDNCLKCAGNCVRDRDGDHWFRLPNGRWAMHPLEAWNKDTRDWIDTEYSSQSMIHEAYGPLEYLGYMIHEEEELIYA
jgi:hypothetical protein